MKHLSNNNFNNNQLDNVPTPVDPNDAVNKAYVDNSLAMTPNRYVEGVNLYSIGHSFANFPYNHSYFQYTSGHALRIRERLRFGDFHYHGRGGTWATDMLARLISPVYDGGKGLWTPNAKGVVLIQNYMNEIGYATAGDSLTRNMWANSIRGEIAVANSSAIVPWEDNIANTGGWLVAGGDYTAKGVGGTMNVNTQATAGTVDFHIPSGDEVWVACAITVPGTTITPWTASCSGNNLLTFDGEGLKANYNDAILGSNQTITTRLVKVTGLNAAAGTTGSKTLRITGQAGANTILSGIVIPNSVNPPRVFLAKEPQRGYPANTHWTNNHVWFENMIDTIAAEFTNVEVVDLLDGWDGSIMLSSDNLHPNDIGQSHIADKYVQKINETITGWDAGVVTI